MIHTITVASGRTAFTYGGFQYARKAERARELLEDTNLFEEVLVETVPVYSSVDDWREKELPETGEKGDHRWPEPS